MKEYSKKEKLCFDDVLLVPQHSNIVTRKDVNLSTTIGRGNKARGMSIPVIAAPMDTVCEWQMAVKLRQLGGLGIIHRYMSIEEQLFQLRMINGHKVIAGFAIGATGDYLQRSSLLAQEGATTFLVDTANGHSELVVNAIKQLKLNLGNKVHIMAGNVSTKEGFKRLADVGADSIRVGIGGGSVCTTRIVTGHGMPTLASVMEIFELSSAYKETSIIADGGIKNSGDAAKALAAGADAVMLGSYLAGTDESPGNVVINSDGMFKEFRGMASREAQFEGRGSVSVVEGVSTLIKHKGKLEDVLNEFSGGLRSALSYTGVNNLKDFKEESEYIRVTYSALGENIPHATKQ